MLTIAGSLEQPTSGDVWVGGQLVSGMSRDGRARLRRRSIGYVFQDFNLLAGLTAAENVSLPLELDGVRGRSARAAAMQALQGLGLADRAHHFPDELSGGERQRVAIARAVVGERSCCWPMSRRGRWTPPTERPSWASSERHARREWREWW
jgi:putative ABC transport system ATP-binding protein